jgi:hypothetical protein
MISINYGPVPNGTGPYYLLQFTYHFPADLVISETKINCVLLIFMMQAAVYRKSEEAKEWRVKLSQTEAKIE